MKKDNNKKKSSGFNLTYMVVFMLVGAACGFMMMYCLDGVLELDNAFFSLALKLVIFALTYYAQMIIHEAGHLVAGLISGYSFGSFRIGSLIFVKENGEIKLKKQSVAGTGGQCLMLPPEMVDGKYPVVFYNLGGVLMNIVFTLVFALVAAMTYPKVFCELPCVSSDYELIYAISVLMVLSGVITAATNGIPLKLGMINNDGSNALELYKNEEDMRVLWNQFYLLEELRNGTRVKDMPAEWFFMPSDEGMKNSITASGAVFLENRLVDEGKYFDALELINKLLNMESALVGLHRNLLLCDKMTLLLIIDGNNVAEADAIYNDKGMQAFFKQMKNTISIVRAEYAHALLCKRDEKRAEELLSHFEKCAKMHPYPVEIETERELIEKIKFASKRVD